MERAGRGRAMETVKIQSQAKFNSNIRKKDMGSEMRGSYNSKGLGDAAGRTRLGLASISLSHYINVATLSSNVGTVDSSNDGSAVAELKANEVGHSNWQEEKVVLSRGSNPGHSVSPDYKQQKLKGSFTSSPTARGINSGSNIWECDRVGREDGSLTREETNGSFQSKTTKVDDIQSNSWTANPRIFPLSRSASSRRSYRGKSILENHKGKLTANTSRFAREQWGRKSSSPSVSPSPRRKDSSRLQFEGSYDIGLVKRALDYSKFFPTFVATGPPVPYMVFPFGPEIYHPSHYPWDGPGRSLSINLNYVQVMGYSSRQMPVMSLQFGLVPLATIELINVTLKAHTSGWMQCLDQISVRYHDATFKSVAVLACYPLFAVILRIGFCYLL
ncbi:hypothetical protein ZIOFF_066232 [Zingiber officinale]|uniref:Uncharacterized protein n=1 Tax=Zingiber officinale TaxID=94328 RepID=A0A8J5F180_ZINOF|nr:hypothetical protein ZIOFF_066232 [Zingiber officinale]